MLIASSRHTAADLATWRELERQDLVLAKGRRLPAIAARSADVVRAFCSSREGYISVSWGKDSVVMLSIAIAACNWPIAWIRIRGHDNPDCELVRDSFFASRGHRNRYCEIEGVADGDDPIVSAHRDGFAKAVSLFGAGYITGLRGQESSTRRMRMRKGLALGSACAPIGWWSDVDVFAWLARERLPVHPAYACSMGGTVQRGQLRVAGIGGERGTRFGRAEWERRYYPEI